LSQSGEKTEKATPKKRKDEREKGNILKSQDMTSALVLVCVFGAFKILSGFIGSRVMVFTGSMLSPERGLVHYMLTPEIAGNIFLKVVVDGLFILFPLLAVVVVSTSAISLAQTRFLFTTKTLEMKLEKLNPINGFKRIFSHKSVAELVKSLLKITVIFYVLYSDIMTNINLSPHILAFPIADGVAYMFNTALDIALKCSVVLAVMATLDLLYQWWSHEKELKMTKHEVKEEYKNIEGNPQIKQKIAQKQREMSAARMMADVPKADVVITNPTHFAVALKYNPKEDKAPLILAMGQDYLALKIKEIAKTSKVAIVENVELARALYKTGKIGKSIPVDLYKSVAKVLAYVAKLKQENKL